MAAIATPIYTIFYGYDPLGSNVLYLSSFTAISLGLFTVLMAILQGLSENGLAIKYLVLGIIIKFAVQLPMIQLFKVYGPLLATNIGLIITIWLSLKHLKVRYKYNSGRTSRRFIGIAIFSMAMFVVVTGVVDFGGKLISPERRPTSFILVILAVAVGGILYAFLSVKFGLAQKIIGPKVNRVLARLHIRI
jgi:O-antigen/teichoic acid export membrane protein